MGKQKSKAASSRQPTTITMSAFGEKDARLSSPPSPTQHRQQYQQQPTQQVYRPSYPPQQQYPPPQQYQQPQYPPPPQQQQPYQQQQQQQQQHQQYQPPYLQQQYQPPPPQQYPPQQYPPQQAPPQPFHQQAEYPPEHQQQESSPPQSPQDELNSPIAPKRTGSFKGLPPIRRGSTFGISLKEATSSGMIDDSDIPPVPSLSPSADFPDHSLLGSDVAAPAENGTNISIGQGSDLTLVGADSSRTRRTSLMKDTNRDSQHTSHRSSSASHSLQIDTVAANADSGIPAVPAVPAEFGHLGQLGQHMHQPQHVQERQPQPTMAIPAGFTEQTSNLDGPLVAVARKRAGTNSSPQQPASFGLSKETMDDGGDPSQTFGNPSGFGKDAGIGAATPVSPVQSTYHPSVHPPLQSPTRATRPSNPPSAAARHPALFPNVPQSPTSRSRSNSAGQVSTHSDQPVSRFSTDSNVDNPQQQGWGGAVKHDSPKIDEDGNRTRMSLLKNRISNRINQLPQRDSRNLIPDHRPHSTEPANETDDDSVISQENPPMPKRKRTSVLTGTAVGNRSSMDDMRYGRPGSPANSHKAPSTHSEKKRSLFGKMKPSNRFKSGLAKTTTLGSVHESTATSSLNSNGTSLKSRYFTNGLSSLAGKLKRQGKDNQQQMLQTQIQTRPYQSTGPPLTRIGSNDPPSEPSSPNGVPGGGFFSRPRTGSTAAAPIPQPPPSIPEHEQEDRPRRGSMSGMFNSLRGKGASQTRLGDEGVNGRPETPPLSAPLRPPPLFAPRSISPTGPIDPDNEGMYQNGPRMGRPISQSQPQQVRPSPLGQGQIIPQPQSESRLNLEESSDESDEEDHLVGHRDSTSPSLTTARTSGPSQRGSGPTAPKQDHSDPSDFTSRPMDGEMHNAEQPGRKGVFSQNGIPPNEGAYGSARRQPTPHSGALPAFMGMGPNAKPALGLRRPSEDLAGASQGVPARKPLPKSVPIQGFSSATTTVPRPATPESVSEPPAHPASASGWGSTPDVTEAEAKTLKEDKQLPGAPGSSPPRGIVSEPSIASMGPASGRYPSPQPSSVSVISAMQNQGEAPDRVSASMTRPDPQKSGWKTFKNRVSSGLTQPKPEKEKSSGGKLFSVLKRGSKAPGPIKGIEEEHPRQNGPLPSPLNPQNQLQGSGHRPMYTVVARHPGQIPAGAVPVSQQGPGQPAHWDNPQALGALGRGQQPNGEGHPQQPSRMQQMLTKVPEIQYGSVPIPKGYSAVHGEGGTVPTSYHVGPHQQQQQQQQFYPQGQQPGQPYPYGAQQQTFNGQLPQGQMPPSPLPPGLQQGPQSPPDGQHDPYGMGRNGSVSESHAPSIVSVPAGVQASREALNQEDDKSSEAVAARGMRPPQLVQRPDRPHEINVAGALPTPASQEEFVLPIQGAGPTQNGSQLSQWNGAAQINGSLANENRPNILRGNSVASDGARSNESGVMGIYSPMDKPLDGEVFKPSGLHLKVSNANLTSSEISRENSSASSEGHSQERVAQRVEVIKVVSPTNSISNETIKGGPGSIGGSSRRARSIDVQNPSTRSRAGSKLAAESSQSTKTTARDSNDDLYDATPKIKQGDGKPATSAPETPSKPKLGVRSPAENKPKAASPVPQAKAAPIAQPRIASPVGQAKASPAVQAKAPSPVAQAKTASPVAQRQSPVAQGKTASPVAQIKAASPVAQAKAASPATQAKAASPATQAKAAPPASQAKAPAQPKATSPVAQTKAAPPPKSSTPDSGEASRGFTVELADTADARMRTLRLNEQEEKIFYEPEGEPPKMTATSYPGQEWNPYGEPEFWTDD